MEFLNLRCRLAACGAPRRGRGPLPRTVWGLARCEAIARLILPAATCADARALRLPATAAERRQGTRSIQLRHADGKKVTSDQADRRVHERRQVAAPAEQRRLRVGDRRDRRPTLTVEEARARPELADLAREAKESRDQAARSARDRDLLQRYPNEAAHRKAREKALDDVGSSVAQTREARSSCC